MSSMGMRSLVRIACSGMSIKQNGNSVRARSFRSRPGGSGR
jgi:hypothetical protein